MFFSFKNCIGFFSLAVLGLLAGIHPVFAMEGEEEFKSLSVAAKEKAMEEFKLQATATLQKAGEEFEELKQSAKQGDTKAQLDYGDFLWFQENNPQKARKYFKLAVKQGDEEAHYSLGCLYYSKFSSLFPVNAGDDQQERNAKVSQKIIKHFTLAGESNFRLEDQTSGYDMLGHLYAEDDWKMPTWGILGNKQDLEQSAYFYTLAAERGSEIAKNALKKMQQ